MLLKFFNFFLKYKNFFYYYIIIIILYIIFFNYKLYQNILEINKNNNNFKNDINNIKNIFLLNFNNLNNFNLKTQNKLEKINFLIKNINNLKDILSNIKIRGIYGEIQLSMLLKELLNNTQYKENLMIKKNNIKTYVEFAIKIPNTNIWIPIDSKFPKESYEQLQNAYKTNNKKTILKAKKNLIKIIKNMSLTVQKKYINPPFTTDFAIIFVPFESIYLELIKNSYLLENLKTKFKIIITGPNNLAAIINSIQIGFKIKK